MPGSRDRRRKKRVNRRQEEKRHDQRRAQCINGGDPSRSFLVNGEAETNRKTLVWWRLQGFAQRGYEVFEVRGYHCPEVSTIHLVYLLTSQNHPFIAYP